LAQQVREVVSSPELARQMSQNGERRAHDFSWEKHVDQMVDVARDLIGRRAGRAE
jgi:glycosyltransferase involved in cell wall biosynthesis